MVHVLLTLNELLLQRSRPRGPLGLSLTTKNYTYSGLSEKGIYHTNLNSYVGSTRHIPKNSVQLLSPPRHNHGDRRHFLLDLTTRDDLEILRS